MTSVVEQKPINRRELSYYLLFAIFILFMILIAALTFRFALPRQDQGPNRAPVGASEDYPSTERPYPMTAEETALFLIRTKNGWLALDRRTPYEMSVGRCLLAWEEANGRFVDPCSGSKFSLDGRLLEGPATQALDQYPITEQSGELFVDLTTLIPGESTE